MKALKATSPGLKALSALVDRLGRTPPVMVPNQATWARLRTQQRLRQAFDQVPAQAGPLNSSQLVHRALHLLQADSPRYLEAFMQQVDTLMWLEQANGAGDLVAKAAKHAPKAASKPAKRPKA
jgi:Protein of unknown function (DUF2894)